MADLDPVAFLRATPPFDALPAQAFGQVSARSKWCTTRSATS